MNPIDKTSLTGISGIVPAKVREPSLDQKPGTGAVPFSDLLEKLHAPVTEPKANSAGGLGALKFSAHAQTRMQSRGIELSPGEMLKIKDAVERAGAKGSRESLILTDKAAFVVSVKNGTVITAIDRDSLKENVFTNIDSTVMI